MEEIERKNALRYMLMVYLGENPWAKMPAGVGPWERKVPIHSPSGTTQPWPAIGFERRRPR